MRRWIGRAAVAVIVLIALSLGGAWVRSYWRLDAFSWVRADGSTRAIVSHHGALHLIQAGTRGRERPLKWDAYRIPAGATHAAVHTQGELKWEWLGFARIESRLAPLGLGGAALVAPPPPAPAPALAPAGRAASRPALKLPRDPSIPFMPVVRAPATVPAGAVPLGGITPWGRVRERPLVPWLNAAPSDALIVPYWPLAALAGAYAAVIVRRRLRGVLRRRRGQCVACGYDLRGSSATSDRCPECGQRTTTSAE